MLRAHHHEQFVFLIADERADDARRASTTSACRSRPSTTSTRSHRRAAAWKAKEPDDVDLIEPQVEEYAAMLNLHSFYVRYRLPMMVETQHFEYLL